MRLIDADKLHYSLIRIVHDDGTIGDDIVGGYNAVVMYAEIKGAPTVDAVPVVRCSECEYNNACFTQSFVESEGVLPFDRDTWYCADGKRKGVDE